MLKGKCTFHLCDTADGVGKYNIVGVNMICVLLAAGYATRMYPLTENFPKPLLEIKGKTILDWMVDDLVASGKIDRYVVISKS